MRTLTSTQTVTAALVCALAAGCADSGGDYQEVTPEAAKAAAEDHSHAHGPNGGDVVELGDHSIHAEVVFDEGAGQLDVYLLGEDVSTAHPVALPELTLSFSHGDTSEDFALAAKPLDGEPEGQSSRFSITDAELADEFHEHGEGAELHFTVDGKEYRGTVHHYHDHGDHGHADDGHGHGDDAHGKDASAEAGESNESQPEAASEAEAASEDTETEAVQGANAESADAAPAADTEVVEE